MLRGSANSSFCNTSAVGMPQTRLYWTYPIGFINFVVLRCPRGVNNQVVSAWCAELRFPPSVGIAFENSQRVLQNAQKDHATLAEVAHPYNAFVEVINPYPNGMSLTRAHAPWVFVFNHNHLHTKLCGYSTFVLTILHHLPGGGETDVRRLAAAGSRAGAVANHDVTTKKHR